MNTVLIRKEDVAEGKYPRQWWIVDATGLTLGRLASRIAEVLRGKHKVCFTTHVDAGDFVIVINADKIALTGNKMTDKIYYHHTGYPGGIKSARAIDMLRRKPTEVVLQAVKGMLPKNALNRHAMHRLKVYAGAEHPHEAQKPQPLVVSK